MKILSKNWCSLDNFCCCPNNYEKVSHKITELDKEKARVKEHNSNQSTKSNNLSVLDHIRLNNADRLIIGHLNINSLRNKFGMVWEIIQGKLDICWPQKQKYINLFSQASLG